MNDDQLIFGEFERKLNKAFLSLGGCGQNIVVFDFLHILALHNAPDMIVGYPSLHLQHNIFNRVNMLNDLVGDHWVGAVVDFAKLTHTARLSI